MTWFASDLKELWIFLVLGGAALLLTGALVAGLACIACGLWLGSIDRSKAQAYDDLGAREVMEKDPPEWSCLSPHNPVNAQRTHKPYTFGYDPPQEASSLDRESSRAN